MHLNWNSYNVFFNTDIRLKFKNQKRFWMYILFSDLHFIFHRHDSESLNVSLNKEIYILSFKLLQIISKKRLRFFFSLFLKLVTGKCPFSNKSHFWCLTQTNLIKMRYFNFKTSLKLQRCCAWDSEGSLISVIKRR